MLASRVGQVEAWGEARLTAEHPQWFGGAPERAIAGIFHLPNGSIPLQIRTMFVFCEYV